MNTQHTPEPKDYKPAATYDVLLLQFNALKNILAGCERRCAEYHDGWRKAVSDDATANKADNNAIRETNDRLTNDLLRVEQQRDELQTENAELRAELRCAIDNADDFADRIAELEREMAAVSKCQFGGTT